MMSLTMMRAHNIIFVWCVAHTCTYECVKTRSYVHIQPIQIQRPHTHPQQLHATHTYMRLNVLVSLLCLRFFFFCNSVSVCAFARITSDKHGRIEKEEEEKKQQLIVREMGKMYAVRLASQCGALTNTHKHTHVRAKNEEICVSQSRRLNNADEEEEKNRNIQNYHIYSTWP